MTVGPYRRAAPHPPITFTMTLMYNSHCGERKSSNLSCYDSLWCHGLHKEDPPSSERTTIAALGWRKGVYGRSSEEGFSRPEEREDAREPEDIVMAIGQVGSGSPLPTLKRVKVAQGSHPMPR
ncbi:hypothetical protein AAFF_G00141020 [Aldrovandia affinis]|uniref:Uncharacterized protein n=1 Tax=Aldrovandia affinis TaxID=143900 RepID=A0AAD7X319_9TELE|nr:hypothetical protein AAFF_G00141020 [Aldrovandia affinis]